MLVIQMISYRHSGKALVKRFEECKTSSISPQQCAKALQVGKNKRITYCPIVDHVLQKHSARRCRRLPIRTVTEDNRGLRKKCTGKHPQ